LSLRLRWRTARSSPPEGPADSTVEALPWWATLPAAPAISVLLELAAARRTGALECSANTVYLVEGRVSQVVSPGVPGIAERILGRLELRGPEAQAEEALRASRLPRLQVRALLAGAAADAALEIVNGGPWTTRFVEGRQHWAPLPRTQSVDELLGETARRRAILTIVANHAGPDEPVNRAERLPVGRIKLTARQWDLVRLADGRTPRAMAGDLAAGVFDTTVAVAALAQAGLLAATIGTATHDPMPFLQAVSGP
jgi:hypothetical protein